MDDSDEEESAEDSDASDFEPSPEKPVKKKAPAAKKPGASYIVMECADDALTPRPYTLPTTGVLLYTARVSTRQAS